MKALRRGREDTLTTAWRRLNGNSREGMVKRSRRVPQNPHSPEYPVGIANLVLCAYSALRVPYLLLAVLGGGRVDSLRHSRASLSNAVEL